MLTQTPGGDVRTVVACYSIFDKFFPACGLLDYSEGMYFGDPATPYDTAQRNQIAYLLDEVRCGPGSRILEVGCGNGTLLDEVRRRGARGVGLTISPEQVRLCRSRGLDARLLDYRVLDATWDGRFDAAVANGPMEHFVQPDAAAHGEADMTYAQFFRIAHRAIDPASPVRRLINTTIHFVRRPDPADLLKNPWRFPRNSDAYHYALLARSFGGWYPVPGQFARCAGGSFRLVKEVDGTQDYCWTSEEWLRRMRRALASTAGWKVLFGAVPAVVRHPRQMATMLWCMLGSESWNWQFRGTHPPTKLLRQTWEYVDRAPAPHASSPAGTLLTIEEGARQVH